MKLLLFSDVHGDLDACRRLVHLARSVDVVVGAGDFGVMRQRLVETIDVLAAIETPTIVVPGNGESFEELRTACAGWTAAQVLHGSATTVGGQVFYGLGGGVPVTPFGAWSYDLSEAQAAELLHDVPEGAVLVTHSPPHGACDRDEHDVPRGSTAVREAVQRARPLLVVCGHIHRAWEHAEQLGPTTIVNAGPRGIERSLHGDS